MPIYEYTCAQCGQRFDHLWTSLARAEAATVPPPCPHCGAEETQRVVSQVAVLGELGGLTPGEQRGLNAQYEREASFTPKEQIQQLQANKKGLGSGE
jgi:putative FmdB family regulatory protein